MHAIAHSYRSEPRSSGFSKQNSHTRRNLRWNVKYVAKTRTPHTLQQKAEQQPRPKVLTRENKSLAPAHHKDPAAYLRPWRRPGQAQEPSSSPGRLRFSQEIAVNPCCAEPCTRCWYWYFLCYYEVNTEAADFSGSRDAWRFPVLGAGPELGRPIAAPLRSPINTRLLTLVQQWHNTSGSLIATTCNPDANFLSQGINFTFERLHTHLSARQQTFSYKFDRLQMKIELKIA